MTTSRAIPRGKRVSLFGKAMHLARRGLRLGPCRSTCRPCNHDGIFLLTPHIWAASGLLRSGTATCSETTFRQPGLSSHMVIFQAHYVFRSSRPPSCQERALQAGSISWATVLMAVMHQVIAETMVVHNELEGFIYMHTYYHNHDEEGRRTGL